MKMWIESSSGWWTTDELDRELGITTTKDRDKRSKYLRRFKERVLVEQHPRINKQYRYVNTHTSTLDFRTATKGGAMPIKWPLGIEQYVNLFPGNIAVVAGAPNAGKTALLLNFIYLNQDQYPIYYFCSEMGEVELRDRLEQFAGISISEWDFEAIERASDFADVIRTDCINIVDFMEMTTELYLINDYLTAIPRKLGSGIAIIAIQEKQGAPMGRGQEFGLEKPRLYLSMDQGKLQIIKGKSWASKTFNPNGSYVSFEITDGCLFNADSEWKAG